MFIFFADFIPNLCLILGVNNDIWLMFLANHVRGFGWLCLLRVAGYEKVQLVRIVEEMLVAETKIPS